MAGPAERIDRLLAQYVTPEGRVDYEALQGDGAFCQDMKRMAMGNNPPPVTRDGQLAFLINAYNAAVLCAVVEDLTAEPAATTRGNGGLWRKLRFFVLRRFPIGGRKMSLWSLENRIRKFGDPRIHFALVCASNSCPALRDGLYAADRLDADLDAAATLFINSPRGVVLDRSTRTLSLSQIFRWYARDFDPAGGVLSFIAKYLPPEDAAFLREHRDSLRIEYMPYDWGLNAA